MEVILFEKIDRLGNIGDLVNVKAGFARNFLLPQGKAKVATDANKAEIESRKGFSFSQSTVPYELVPLNIRCSK